MRPSPNTGFFFLEYHLGMIKPKHLLILLLCFTFSAVLSAQRVKQFTQDSIQFRQELAVFFLDQSSAKNKGLAKGFVARFSLAWTTGKFDLERRQEIYRTTNGMLSKRYKAFPQMYQYLQTQLEFTKRPVDRSSYKAWQASVNTLLNTTSGKTISAYLESCLKIFQEQTLVESRGVKWHFAPTDFMFVLDSVPYVVFKPTRLICESRKDSFVIEQTTGRFYPTSLQWVGEDGVVRWERAGLEADAVYAVLEGYQMNLRYAKFQADSAQLHYKGYFEAPLVGQLKNQLVASAGRGKMGYPRFYSYDNEIQIRKLFKQIDFSGGFAMEGARIIGSGVPGKAAHITISREGKQLADIWSERFVIRPDRVYAQSAAVSLYIDNDSIYHPGLTMKYMESDRELSLIRTREGLAKSPFFNSYHEVDMYPTALYWKIDEPLVAFSGARGISKGGRALFESTNFYTLRGYDGMQGMDPVHPLYILRNFSRKYQTRSFFLYELSEYMKKPDEQVKSQLINLANRGFLIYDSGKDWVKLKNRLFDYLDAREEKTDYDAIRFVSDVKEHNNAELNLTNNELKLKGVQRVFLSDSQAVYIYPRNYEILLQKNRNFVFTGRVHAGMFDFYANECSFDYGKFKLNLPTVDSLSFLVKAPRKSPQEKDSLVRVKSVIANISGDLFIDEPNNKSGIKPFPEYPKFISKDDSYVYYDQDSSYLKEQFYFHVEPFELDSLDNFTTTGLEFSGALESGGIFPEITTPLRVRSDYSLGFTHDVAEEGIPVYGGRGIYYTDIDLNGQGLSGKGRLEYRGSETRAADFKFYPDSMMATAQSFHVQQTTGSINYPEISGEDVLLSWYPYDQVLQVKNDTAPPFKMYQNQAILDGQLTMNPNGILGSGMVKFDKAELVARQFDFQARSFRSDTTRFRLKIDTSAALALRADIHSAFIDFDKRRAVFRTQGDPSLVAFPVNQYQCYMKGFDWLMDDDEIVLEANGHDAAVDRKSLTDWLDFPPEGSEFVSTNPALDSLRFIANRAVYNMKDYFIRAEGVPVLRVADVAVFPDNGLITIQRDGRMDAIAQAHILLDTANRIHQIHDAKVKVLSRNDYLAEGFYRYKDRVDRVETIGFEKIYPDTVSGHSVAYGTVRELDGFRISPEFDFMGEVKLEAHQPNLYFDGAFRIRPACESVKKRWVAFASRIHPSAIQLPLNDTLTDYKGRPLLASVQFNRLEGGMRTAFLDAEVPGREVSVMGASGYITYDTLNDAYRIADSLKLKNPDQAGTELRLQRRDCTIKGEGLLDLKLDFGQMQMVSGGNMMQALLTDSIAFRLMMGLQFYFSKEAMGELIKSLQGAELEAAELASAHYKQGLAFIMGPERAKSYFEEINLYGGGRKLPPELNFGILFSELKMYWNPATRSFLSKGPLALGGIGQNPVNKKVNGYLEIVRKRSGDALNLYLETGERQWYFFSYSAGVMQAISSNQTFNNILIDTKEEKRVMETPKNSAPYQYIISTQRKRIDFVRRMRNINP